ncbi:MAG TPA: EAL domain-containing protein [Polyangiaceae bacterium]|jgi:EAL domain-containing protein (putative c-di-GMP-specific phosphodiesterase class I)
MASPPRNKPRSNRLSDAPPPIAGAGRRDSYIALETLVSPAELSVVFQPIVDLATGKLFAHEALVRCSATSFKGPMELFERAVEVGCAGRLGRMIREIAVPLASGGPIFLNVHPQELQESWLIRPDDPIFSHDHQVFLEITESVPLTHHELCMGVLSELRARSSVQLVVDDLGSGYSNLKRIADLEPKVVKLDRGLIEDVAQSKRQRQLIASVVRLCQDLGATVVAEGIETDEEFQALCDTGAHYGQGFLFARPAYPMPKITWPPSSGERSTRSLSPSGLPFAEVAPVLK